MSKMECYSVIKRNEVSITCDNMDEPWKHHAHWKPVKKGHIVYYFPYMKCPEQADPYRKQIGGCLWLEKEDKGENWVVGCFLRNENTLKTQCDNCSTTLNNTLLNTASLIYLLKTTGLYFKVVKFLLWLVSHFLKRWKKFHPVEINISK